MIRVLCVALMLAVSLVASGFGGTPPVTKAQFPHLIDNFEDGNYDADPAWFVFDNVTPEVEKTVKLREGDEAVIENLGEYALTIKGSTTSWYVGGMGCVLDLDASGYNTFEIDIDGNGEGTGTLKIELYDDDNGNDEIEVDKSWKPLFDDLFVAEIPIDWTGWKHVSIPISEFKIEGRGNKKFDPNLAGGSSGLNKIQLICVASAEEGDFDISVDNIELGVK
jgi:hypothetical protein